MRAAGLFTASGASASKRSSGRWRSSFSRSLKRPAHLSSAGLGAIARLEPVIPDAAAVAGGAEEAAIRRHVEVVDDRQRQAGPEAMPRGARIHRFVDAQPGAGID